MSSEASNGSLIGTNETLLIGDGAGKAEEVAAVSHYIEVTRPVADTTGTHFSSSTIIYLVLAF